MELWLAVMARESAEVLPENKESVEVGGLAAVCDAEDDSAESSTDTRVSPPLPPPG